MLIKRISHPEPNRTELLVQDRLADAPLYAHVKEVRDLSGSLEALEITYITLYAYNGWYPLLGLSFAPKVGAHDGDWEHLTVRLEAPTFSLQASNSTVSLADLLSCSISIKPNLKQTFLPRFAIRITRLSKDWTRPY